MTKTAQDYLGFTFTDRVTGLTGVATGYVVYLSGCNQVLLTPRVDKEGKTIESHWIDEQRCDLRADVARIALDNSDNPGFDKAAPKR